MAAIIYVDFLFCSISNSIDSVKFLIIQILETSIDNDYIKILAKGFEEISLPRKYHCIINKIIGQIKNVRVPFNIDMGIGDIIVLYVEERIINKQLHDLEAPVIMTYSLENTIVEKFDAILR